MPIDVPAWFRDALATPCEVHVVEVDGVPIDYRAWGPAGAPLTMLVHGGAAHARWWDHVAPYLADGHRVVAPDLSGHGDSGWSEPYSQETWARQCMAVAAQESSDPPILVGHSNGGFVVLTAARMFGDRLRGVVAIDSPVREMSAETRARLAASPQIPDNKVYPDRRSVLERFRTLPEDDAGLPYVRDHLASHSVHRVDDGWTWKFDPRIFLTTRLEPDDIARARCDVVLVRGERGMATIDITTDVAERLGGHVPVVVVPDAGHHVMIDQPVALIAALQALVGQWRKT